MKIKIKNNLLTENVFLKFFYILSMITSLSLFSFKIFINAEISWFLIIFNLIACLYFNKSIKYNK